MFREDYRREMEAISPTEEEMERLMAAMEEERPMKKRVFRTVLLAAALCAALTVSALAASPTLREALAAALGSFGPYSQTVEGLSVTDQGIEVRVVSALSDGNMAKVYYEVRDLTGDRLDQFTTDDLMAPMPINRGDGGGVDWVSAGSSGIGGLVSYDHETKTALMVGGVLGKGAPAEELVLGLDIGQIEPGWRHGEFFVDPAGISEEPLKSMTLENGKSVLAPNQTSMELEDEFFSLSSFGYGEDGVLHCQVRVKEGVDDSQWESDYDSVYYFGGTSRSDTAPYYSRTARYIQSTDYTGMNEEEREFASPQTRFQKDGVTYYDIRTGITPADVVEGDVEWSSKGSYFLNTRPIIRGEWNLEVPVEMVEKTPVDLIPSQTVINGVTARTLHLSVLGVTLESDPNGTANTLGYPLTLYLANGTVLAQISADGLFHAGGYAVNHWSFPEPIETERVIAVAIGMWYIPIEGGTAQPGHWLSELPRTNR